MRCFPAVALAWDRTSGLHIYPNLISETVTVDSAPALWNSAQGSEKTTVMLLVYCHFLALSLLSPFFQCKLIVHILRISSMCILLMCAFFALIRLILIVPTKPAFLFLPLLLLADFFFCTVLRWWLVLHDPIINGIYFQFCYVSMSNTNRSFLFLTLDLTLQAD